MRVLLGLLVLVAVALADLPNLWPMPSSVTYSECNPLIGHNLSLECDGTTAVCGMVQDYWTWASPRIYPLGSPATTPGSITTITLVVFGADTALTLEVDEAYTLSVTKGAVTMTAQSVYAAMRGIETLIQMTTPEAPSTYSIQCGQVTDAPRFPWRGLMVDTARHFLSISAMKRQIDAVAIAKMNVLHVHLVDAQ
ncbi:beta-hexosaminidase, partial [Kipferlia bialata]|eukprot:g8804.t1